MNEHIQEWYNQNEDKVRKLMHDIWLHPELGLKEEYAANATAKFASEQGFTTVELHNAENFDDETALKNSVVAKWGNGRPAIAFVGELDALPGLGQELVPYKSPVEGPGHACAHNTMAGCAAAAASSVKYAMEKEGIQGTVVLAEAPAEEIGRGKAALARAGVFKDLDLILMRHPGSGDLNVAPSPMMVIYNALFEFFGTSYHAAGKHGERGRSALDAAQLMNIGCEFLREHLPRFNTSHHYCFRNGGLLRILCRHMQLWNIISEGLTKVTSTPKPSTLQETFLTGP